MKRQIQRDRISLSSRLYDRSLSVSQRLIVTPLLSPIIQVDEAGLSVDLRLGNKFIVKSRAHISKYDPMVGNSPARNLDPFSSDRHFVIPHGSELTLHPGQFILAGSFEYLSIPADMMGYVISRSSWGRLGLIIATAIGVHPGFKGCLTFELSNVGEVPISLRPLYRLAQLILHSSDSAVSPDRSQFEGAIGPESPSLHLDSELDKIAAFNVFNSPST